MALVPVALSPSAGPPPPSRNALNLLALYRISPLGVVGCFAVGLSNAAFYSLAPLFGQSLGLSVSAIAQFMTVTIFAGMLMQWPIGRLSDRRDRRHVIVGVTAGVIAASSAIAVVGGWSLPLLIALVAVYGGLSLTIYPLMVAHANDFTGAGQRVAASARLLLAYGIGAVIDHNTGQAYTYPSWVQLVFGQTLVFDRQNDKENQPVPPTPAAPASGVEVAKKP